MARRSPQTALPGRALTASRRSPRSPAASNRSSGPTPPPELEVVITTAIGYTRSMVLGTPNLPSVLLITALVWVPLVVSLPLQPAAAQGVESQSGAAAESPGDNPSTSSKPAWLGVQIAGEASNSRGAPVTRILEDSPAERADLKVGDRLLAVGDRDVDDLDSLRAALANHSPGDEIELSVHRDDSEVTLRAVLSAKPAAEFMLRRQFIGEPLPDLEVETLDGTPQPLTADRDKPLVVEFWTTWCPPCRQTRATLQALEERYGEAIDIVGISPESRGRLKAYRKQHDLPYPLRRDVGRKAHERLMVDTYPTLFVVDGDGRVVQVFTGADHRQALTSTLEDLVE